jgi:hypothetical protein
MSDARTYKGGCLCGAVRWESHGEPMSQGYCCCPDCRKASGSGFIPWMMFSASVLHFTGQTKHSIVQSIRGSDAVRNHCAQCGGLVFGGIVGQVTNHTIYAGSLDEPALFQPQMALFVRSKPDWVVIPPGLKTFDTLPGL